MMGPPESCNHKFVVIDVLFNLLLIVVVVYVIVIVIANSNINNSDNSSK
jgi:hypothetical protein